MNIFNPVAFREDLSRLWPAAFEVTSTHALAPLTPDAHNPHVAFDVGNSKEVSPTRIRWIF